MLILGNAIDFSSGIPSALTTLADGYSGVLRYLPKYGGTSIVHTLTPTDFHDYDSHDVGVGLIYEALTPNRALSGTSGGNIDGPWAMDKAVQCGISNPRGAFFTSDFDANPDDILPYYEAIATKISESKTWAYGSYRVITRLFAEGLITKGWQTMAWSHGSVADNICLYQRIGTVYVGGVPCDIDNILLGDWGQHNYIVPDTPTERNDVDVIRYVRNSDDGGIWECNINNGTRQRIPNPATVTARKSLLGQFPDDIRLLSVQMTVDSDGLLAYGTDIGA